MFYVSDMTLSKQNGRREARRNARGSRQNLSEAPNRRDDSLELFRCRYASADWRPLQRTDRPGDGPQFGLGIVAAMAASRRLSPRLGGITGPALRRLGLQLTLQSTLKLVGTALFSLNTHDTPHSQKTSAGTGRVTGTKKSTRPRTSANTGRPRFLPKVRSLCNTHPVDVPRPDKTQRGSGCNPKIDEVCSIPPRPLPPVFPLPIRPAGRRSWG